MELRNEPVQARSVKTLERLTQAARELVSEVGVDRLTTGDIAVRAGTSIGTVYRYFPDRVAVLDVIQPDRHDAAALQTRLDQIENLARGAAIAAHALGHADDERRFLDIVIAAQGDAG